jgi:Glycosyltransferase family 87
MGVRQNALSTVENQTGQLDHEVKRASNQFLRGRMYLAFRWLLRATLVTTLLQMALLWFLKPVEILFITTPFLIDFSYYYVAALSLRLNPHANIFDPRLMPAVAHAHRLFIGKGAGTFNYPLLLPIALIPLTLLAFPWAARVWYFFNIALWVLNTALLIDCLRLGLFGVSSVSTGGIRHWLGVLRGMTWADVRARWRDLSDVSRFSIIFGLFVCLFYGPLIEAQAIGQASMLMLTCFLLALWFLRRGRPELAGVMLTIATLVKIFPAFLLLYFVLRGQWRVVLGALGSLIVLLVGMTAVVGLSGVLLMRDIFAAVTSGVFTTFQNVSLERAPMWIAIEMGLRPDNPTATLIGRAMMALAAIAFVGAVFMAARKNRDGAGTLPSSLAREEDLTLGFCWALCTMLLIIPINWEHYYIWLLPAFLFGLGYTLRHAGPSLRSITGRWKLDAWIGLVLLVALLLTFNDLPLGYDGTLTPSLGPYLLGHPLRPFFMLLRPTSAVLIWLALGVQFVRHRVRMRRQRTAAVPPLSGELTPATTNALLDAWRSSAMGATSVATSVPWQRLFGVLVAFWVADLALRAVMALAIGLATPH